MKVYKRKDLVWKDLHNGSEVLCSGVSVFRDPDGFWWWSVNDCFQGGERTKESAKREAQVALDKFLAEVLEEVQP